MAEFINTIDVLGDDAVVDSIIDRSITEFKDDKITSIGGCAFHSCTGLTVVDLPNVTDVANGAFQNCSSLQYINLPKAKKIGEYSCYTFAGCSSLFKMVLPETEFLNNFTWENCRSLTYFEASKATTIGNCTFRGCTSLKCVVLRNNVICNALVPNPFASTPIDSGSGYIYVPRALVDSYKIATNWSAFADQFRALEDYTVDGTTSGELAAGVIRYNLQLVSSSNTETFVIGSYRTTLAVLGNSPFVSVTMDGVDITTDVYNSETHEIVIPQVVGVVVITATAEFDMDAGVAYKLPAPTTFNGTSDYIDTGIKLFDTPKDFTIVCSADFSALGTDICLLHCMNEAYPYPGLCVDGNSGVRICYTGASALITSISSKNNVSALALRFKAGVLDAIRYKDASGNIVKVSHNTAATYTSITQNLLLGAYQTAGGAKGRYYKGTIKSFRVYGVSLVDDLITDVLQTA